MWIINNFIESYKSGQTPNPCVLCNKKFKFALFYKKAKEELLKLFGVGVKVADCICLFALHHLQAFPVDTHIHQAMEAHYKRGFPKRRYKGVEGVLQQYIFYYELAGTPLEAGKRSK